MGYTLPVFNTGNSDTRILPANQHRKKCCYFNSHATAIIYYSYGRGLPYASCFQLVAGAQFTDDTGLFQDELWMGSNVAGATVVIAEGV
jgi:hypothetical protein